MSGQIPFKPETIPYTSEFAVLLLKELHKDEQNLLVSPIVVMSGGMMALPGADGATRAQLLSVLFDEDISTEEMAKERLLKFVGLLNTNLTLNKDVLTVANLAYIRDGVPLSKEYEESLLKNLMVKVKEVKFTVATTRNKIKTDLKNALGDQQDFKLTTSSSDCLLLVSGINFHAQWHTHLFEWCTKADQDFHLDNKQVVKVTMMNDHNPRPFFHDEKEDTKAVSLLYRTEYDFVTNSRVFVSLVLILPREGVELKQFIKQLNGFKLDEILDNIKKGFQVKLKLPRFKVIAEHSLESSLPQLGLEDAFDREKADFGNIKPRSNESSYRVFISQLKQYAVFDVNEKGSQVTESARPRRPDANSAKRFGQNVTFQADRPFLYAVVANSSPRQILFIGAVHNPSK